MGELTLESIRENAVGKHLSEAELNMFDAVMEEREIPIRGGMTHVYIYTPREVKEKYPVMINLHGGGFVKGHRDQDVVYCKNMAQNAGYVVVDVDYKTAPEKKYPYALNECYDVTEYVVRHPEEFKADPEALVIGGHSAGGNLTIGIEFLALKSGAFQPQLLILDYPPVDLSSDPADARYAYAPFIRLSVEQMRAYNDWYIDKEYRREITASPIYATREELEGFPPVLLITAEYDTLAYDAERFALKLIDAGVTVYAKRVKGAEHGFTVRRKAGFEAAEELIFEALERVERKAWRAEK